MKFGDMVTVKSKLVRANLYPSVGLINKAWKESVFKSPRAGIFLGLRTLADGHKYYDSEEGHIFTPKKRFRAALVCLSEREKPVYAFIESITEVA